MADSSSSQAAPNGQLEMAATGESELAEVRPKGPLQTLRETTIAAVEAGRNSKNKEPCCLELTAEYEDRREVPEFCWRGDLLLELFQDYYPGLVEVVPVGPMRAIMFYGRRSADEGPTREQLEICLRQLPRRRQFPEGGEQMMLHFQIMPLKRGRSILAEALYRFRRGRGRPRTPSPAVGNGRTEGMEGRAPGFIHVTAPLRGGGPPAPLQEPGEEPLPADRDGYEGDRDDNLEEDRRERERRAEGMIRAAARLLGNMAVRRAPSRRRSPSPDSANESAYSYTTVASSMRSRSSRRRVRRERQPGEGVSQVRRFTVPARQPTPTPPAPPVVGVGPPIPLPLPQMPPPPVMPMGPWNAPAQPHHPWVNLQAPPQQGGATPPLPFNEIPKAKVLIPRFDGEDDKEKTAVAYNLWKRAVGTNRRIYGDHPRLQQHIENSLDGDASRLACTLGELYRLDDLIALFDAHYKDKRTIVQLRTEFYNLSQRPGESLTQYAVRLSSLADLMMTHPDSGMTREDCQEVKVGMLHDGMKPSLQTSLLYLVDGPRPCSYEELLAAGRKLEQKRELASQRRAATGPHDKADHRSGASSAAGGYTHGTVLPKSKLKGHAVTVKAQEVEVPDVHYEGESLGLDSDEEPDEYSDPVIPVTSCHQGVSTTHRAAQSTKKGPPRCLACQSLDHFVKDCKYLTKARQLKEKEDLQTAGGGPQEKGERRPTGAPAPGTQ